MYTHNFEDQFACYLNNYLNNTFLPKYNMLSNIFIIRSYSIHLTFSIALIFLYQNIFNYCASDCSKQQML